MLIVQPTSTCDVCLERYAWDDSSSDTARPHVITCGHVFCQQCLTNLRVPRTCPLCRASFHLTRAVKIHVDLASPASPTSPTSSISTRSSNVILSRPTQEESEARNLELKLVQAFSASGPETEEVAREDGEGSDEQREGNEEERAANGALEQRAAVIEETRAWLENIGASPGSYPVLRSLLSTLPAHHTLAQDLAQAQAETNRLRSERDHLKRYLRRAERAREQEAALAKSAEKGWLVRVSEIERDCELKLTQAETDRHRLEGELSHLKLALKESQAAQSDALIQAHMQIREHDAQAVPPYQAPGKQQSEAGSSKSMSVSGKATDSDAAGVGVPVSTAGPSTSGIAFPRTSSPSRLADPGPSSSSATASTSAYAPRAPPTSTVTDLRRSSSYSYDFPSHSYSYSEDYDHGHNPLPRPPEPVPLSRLPAFARPKPGSSAYNAARTLARGGSLRREREYSDRGGADGSEKERARAERKREKEMERESRTDSEKDRRERRRERERREREGGAATDSGKERRRMTGRDRYREKDQEREGVNGTGKNKGKGKEKEKERDRGTDTSATETQDRARGKPTVTERTRRASLVGVRDSTSFSHLFPPTSSTHLNGVTSSGRATGNEEGNEKSNPTAPRDVVGGWGLERSWRASYASGSSGKSHSGASQEDLNANYVDSGLGETQGSNVNSLGSNFTKMRVRERLEKDESAVEKGKEGTRGHRGEGGETTADYTLLPSSHEGRDSFSHRPSRDSARDPERQRHVSFSTNSPHDSREQQQRQSDDTSHELPPLHASSHSHSQYPYAYSYSSQGRERRTTLSAAPSALGLVLVPSPDGRGGYTYAYQYQQGQGQGDYGHAQYGHPITLPPQSTIQTASAAGGTGATTSAMGGASGKESITPLASQTRPPGASASGYAALSRRATDSALSTQGQIYRVSSRYAAASQGQGQQQQREAASTAPSRSENRAAPLHVPQPRRISLTIPEPPESDASPPARMQPPVQQSQPTQQQQFFRDGEVNVNSGNKFPHMDGVYAQNQNQRSAGFYENTNPSANMSLDSALASLYLAGASSGSATVDRNKSSAPLPSSSGAISQQQQQTLRHRTSNSSTASASTGISLTGATSKERRKQLLDALFSDSSERVDGSGSGGAESNRSSFTSEEASTSGKPTQGAVPSVGEYRASQPQATMPTAVARANVDVATQSSALRGVPSRDGRPSRGLSPRPSTTQPIQSTAQTAAANQNQTSSYYAHAHYPQVLGSYASTYPTYQAQAQGPSGTSATAAVAAAYAAYSRYYNAQPQAQVHAQMHNAYAHAHAPPTHLHAQSQIQSQSQHASTMTTTSTAVAALPYRTAAIPQTAADAIVASGWSEDHRRY